MQGLPTLVYRHDWNYEHLFADIKNKMPQVMTTRLLPPHAALSRWRCLPPGRTTQPCWERRQVSMASPSPLSHCSSQKARRTAEQQRFSCSNLRVLVSQS